MNLRGNSRLVSAIGAVVGCFLGVTTSASANNANSVTGSYTCEKLAALTAVRAGHLGATFEPQRLMRPQMIGIGLPPESDIDAQIRDTEMRRIHDFSPEKPCADSDTSDQCKFWKAYEDDFTKRGAPLTYGGAGEFLSFLVDQVRPVLARDYRMTGDHTLMGHSAGGAFCYYAIFARHGAFDKYMCGGGRAWRGWPAQEEQYAQTHSDLPIQIYEAISGIDLLAGGPAYSVGTVLNERHYPSLKLYTQIFPDDNHQSVVPMMLSRGLRTLWGGRPGATPDAWKLRSQPHEEAK
jgi:predicted alpha/beta superfamily hydrolase